MKTAPISLTAAALLVIFGARPAVSQQIDLAGMWSASLGNHEELPLRGDPGVEVGEYVGIPLNDALLIVFRFAALEIIDYWSQSVLSLPAAPSAAPQPAGPEGA